MNKRKPLSKKNRFEVFKRDLFTCQYCGNSPPLVILEVDHITPVSKGGDNDQDNLITACFDCNRGKGANLLSTHPETISKKCEKIKEKELQLKEFDKLKSTIKKRKARQAKKVAAVFTLYFESWVLNRAAITSIKSFLNKIDVNNLCEYMELACERNEHGTAFRYFCGICWNKIKEKDHG